MTTFIWDLDGTLVDSYPAIMEALAVIYQYYGWDFDSASIENDILQESVGALLERLAQEKGLAQAELLTFFAREQAQRDDQIELMPGSKQVLAWTKEQGIENFIYTHKGASAHQVLQDLGLADYFTEVLTAASGFKRKPHPQAINYLMEKYELQAQDCYYIGDRPLDVQLAEAATIASINLNCPNSASNRKIDQLTDLLTMGFDK